MGALYMIYLEGCFATAKKRNEKYIGLLITVPGSDVREVIIIQRENFDNKLAYYQKAYTDELVLKANNEIRIVGFAYADTLNGIEEQLLKE